MRCLICDHEMNGCLCPVCGYDHSRNREHYPTLTNDGRRLEAAWIFRARRAEALSRTPPAAAPAPEPTPGPTPSKSSHLQQPVPQQMPYFPPNNRPMLVPTARAPKKKLWLIPLAAVLLCLIVFIGINVIKNGKTQKSAETKETSMSKPQASTTTSSFSAYQETNPPSSAKPETAPTQSSTPISTSQKPESSTAAKSEAAVLLADGSYYAQLLTWSPKDMIVELLTVEGFSESDVPIFQETGTVLDLNISRASIVIDGAWTGGPIYCSSISEAMNTYLSGWEQTLEEVCSKRIRFQVENTIIQEVVIMYLAAY